MCFRDPPANAAAKNTATAPSAKAYPELVMACGYSTLMAHIPRRKSRHNRSTEVAIS